MRKTRRKALVLPAFVMRATTAGSMTGERSRSRKAKLRVAASPRLVPGLEECSDEELIRLDELSTEIVVARGRTLAARGSGPLQTVIVCDGTPAWSRTEQPTDASDRGPASAEGSATTRRWSPSRRCGSWS